MTALTPDRGIAHERASRRPTVRDVFHAAWGLRRHIGVFSPPTATVRKATEQASHIKARKAGVSKGQRVLEVGCGFGLDARMLCESYGCTVIATDAERWRLDEARRHCAGVKGLSFQEADHRRLPFADESFDLAWATETLSYSPELERSLSEVARSVKVGGQIVIADYACSGLLDRRQIMVLNDTKQLWSFDEWTAAFSSHGIEITCLEHWSQHARDTYSRLAEQMLMFDQRIPAVRASINNMRQRVVWIDRGVFRPFLVVLQRRQ